MFRILFLLLVLTAPMASAQQVLGFTMPEGKRKLVIPFESLNNLITVPVVLNKQLPLRFIVDTGVRTAILTDRTYTDMLGLPYTRQYTITGPGGEKLIGALVTNNISLAIPPDLEGLGHSVLVLEKDYLQLASHLGRDVHGILGYELFSRFVVKINYEREELTLLDPARFRKPRGFRSIPITIEDTKPYMIARSRNPDGSVNELKLMVDTGASHCLFIDPQSGPEVHVPAKTIRGSIGRGLGGEIFGRTGRLEQITLGDFQLKNPIASFPDPDSYSDTLRSTTVFRNGTLGGELLSHFTVIFDYSAGRMYIRKNTHFRSRFNFSLSGITVEAKGPKLNSYQITQVRVGSVADRAGIAAGDMLVRINDTQATSMRLGEINALLDSRPGRKITLDLLHDGVAVRKKIILKDDLTDQPKKINRKPVRRS